MEEFDFFVCLVNFVRGINGFLAKICKNAYSGNASSKQPH